MICLAAGMLTSCLDDDYNDRNAEDQLDIMEYMERKGLDLEYDPNSGIHYEIRAEGNPNRKPSADSSLVTVNYEGRLLNDTVFVKGDSVKMDLREQPIGFQLGVSSIGEGGEIMMILPSLVAYGSAEFVTDTPYSVTVPPYSVLVYEVELLKVEKE